VEVRHKVHPKLTVPRLDSDVFSRANWFVTTTTKKAKILLQ